MATHAVRGYRRSVAVGTALLLLASAMLVAPTLVLAADPPALDPIDPQVVTQAANQDWTDYNPIPNAPYGTDGSPGSVTTWDVALILTDFPGTPFAVTQPAGSTIFGNPGPLAHDLPRSSVAAFYRDWLNVPQAINEFQGMNRYWMEDTYGKYGVNLQAYGPYALPGTQDDYFITDFTTNVYCNTQTRTTTAQAGVTNVEVVSSASFPVGKVVTGLSGSRVVLSKPDGTHLATGGATTMPAASVAGATNIKIGSAAGLAIGHALQVGFDDRLETVTITSVGTTGSGGTGVNVTPALTFAHATNTMLRDQVATPITVTANSFVHSCNRTYRTDVLVAWTDHVSAAERGTYDNQFYVSAGQDESGTWQEFGEMLFTQTTVPDNYGPPNAEIPQNWAGTRYIPWTSWVSAASIWPNASGNNSIEGEGSGMAVYAHELTHNLGIADNYNNPYAAPFQRAATGYWSMMSRGSFGGPGGTHQRWHIPSTLGTALGSQHVLRDKIKLNFVTAPNFIDLNRNGLATSGLAVLNIMAREVNPGASGQTGVRINLDGTTPQDKTPACTVMANPATLAAAAAVGATNIKVSSTSNFTVNSDVVVGDRGNDELVRVQSVGTAGAGGTGVTFTTALTKAHAAGEIVSNRLSCSGGSGFNNFSMEVIQQLGSDSFQPDTGVLIEKNRTSESTSCGTFTCFAWIVDAHPTDINMLDFERPDGTDQWVTTGDPRQLTDAAFHAGLNSGSSYEWVDTLNNLHFYVIDKITDGDGVVSYKVAVQNMSGAGPHVRGVSVPNPSALSLENGNYGYCHFNLTNTGSFTSFTNPHPENVNALVSNDVYRLSASATGAGWTAQLANALTAAGFGQTVDVPVYVTRADGAAAGATIQLTATSVSDATKTATATCTVDEAAPTTTADLQPPAVNGWFHNPTVTLTATDDGGSGVASTEYKLDANSYVAYAVPFQVTGEGDHTLLFRSTDGAGNVETANTLNFSIDTVAPETTADFDPPAQNGWFVDPTVTLTADDGTGSVSGVASTEYNLDSGGWTPYTDPFVISGDGSHVLQYRSTDNAGNIGPASTTFMIDATAPESDSDATPLPTNGFYHDPTIVLTSSDGGSGVDYIEFSLDGGAWTTYSAPFQVTGDGPHSLDFRAADLAGNTEDTVNFSFSIDTTPPDIDIESPTDGGIYEVGFAETASYSCDDAISGYDSCDGPVANGADFDTSTTGWHTFTVDASDVAGNTSSASVDYYVYSATTVTEDVQNDLEVALAGATNNQDANKLSAALDKLSESLNPEWWDATNSLDEQQGHLVFEAQKQALQQLEVLLKDKNSDVPDAEVEAWISLIVASDRKLALNAIDLAESTPGSDTHKIDLAQSSLQTGDARVAQGKPTLAVDKYRDAWSKATDALIP